MDNQQSAEKQGMSAEDFTRHVSPGKIGVRADLRNTGFLNRVHDWIQRYADLHTADKSRQIADLQQEVERLREEYAVTEKLAVEYLQEVKRLNKSEIKFRDRVNDLEHLVSKKRRQIVETQSLCNDMAEALTNIESACDNQNIAYENIWSVACAALQRYTDHIAPKES